MRGKGEGSIYKDAQGRWTAAVELPSRDGRRRRKVIRSVDKKVVLAELTKLRTALAKTGDLVTSSPTVQAWFATWLRDHALHVAPNTINNYRGVTDLYIVPVIGKKRLEKVTPDDVRAVAKFVTTDQIDPDTKEVVRPARSSTYALNVHRVLSAGLRAAYADGKVGHVATDSVKAPRKTASTLEAFTVDEAIELLRHVATEPHGARWATSLLTGARRGEVLGLEPDRVTDTLDLSWQLQRIKFEHGCKRPCGLKRAGACPDRRMVDVPPDYETRHLEGGLYLTRPKSSSGWRVIPLVEPLQSILWQHMANDPGPLVFHRDRRPIDPAQDTREWRAVLHRSGIDRDVRLHDLRHTTVDLLYMAGVPEDIIVKIVGHSTMAQTRAYRSGNRDPRMLAAMESLSGLLAPKEIAN